MAPHLVVCRLVLAHLLALAVRLDVPAERVAAPAGSGRDKFGLDCKPAPACTVG